MFLTFLSRLMATLLTLLLFSTIVGLTVDQTILNTTYVEHKLQSQNAYSRLSDALSTEISKNSGDQIIPQPEVAAQLKTVLTPAVLQQKIDVTLKQLQAYFRNNGPVPTLDVSDLMQQAKQSGLDVQSDKFNKPVTLTAATKLKKVSDTARVVSIGTLVAAGVLLLGVLAIAIKRRNYKPLANIVFALGIMLTIWGGLILTMPSLFSKFYKVNTASSPFSSLAHDLAVVTMHDVGLRLLVAGVVALLLGIGAKYALRGTGHAHHEPHESADVSAGDSTSAELTPNNTQPSSAGDDTSQQTPTDRPTLPGNQTPGAPPRPRGSRKIQL